MPVTIDTANGPIVMTEMWEDFKKGIDISRGPYVETTYYIPHWRDTDAVINALMGSTSGSGGPGTIHVPGFRCPTSPNLTCMDAYAIGEAEYDAKDGGHVSFNIAKVRAVFGIRSWEQFPEDDPQQLNSFTGNPGGPVAYAIHSMDFGVESVKLPGSAYKFVGSTLPCDYPMVVHVGTCTLTVELKKVPYLPSITIMNLIGKLNDNTFFGAPTGRVLFLGARTSKEFETDGTRVQNVSYTFKYRAHSWNRFPRTDNGKFSLIENAAGDNPYLYADLKPLIALQGFAGMGTITETDT